MFLFFFFPTPRWQKIFKSRLVGLAVAYGNTVFVVLIVILVLLLFGGCWYHGGGGVLVCKQTPQLARL